MLISLYTNTFEASSNPNYLICVFLLRYIRDNFFSLLLCIYRCRIELRKQTAYEARKDWLGKWEKLGKK